MEVHLPRSVSDDIAQHAALLVYHDPGDANFDGSAQRFAELWEDLVPQSGEADSPEGEVLRSLGRLASEHRRNGNINWGPLFEGFVELLERTLTLNPLLDDCRISEDLEILMEDGRHGRRYDEARTAIGRLIVDVVAYCDGPGNPSRGD